MTLSDRPVPGFFGGLFSLQVQADSAGRYFLNTLERDRMVAFGGDGRFLRTIGRSGAGPGEFRSIGVPIVGPGGRIHVPDLRLGRISVIDSNLEIARQFSFPYRPSIVRDDGTIIVAQQIAAPPQAGYPIHLVHENGRVIRSFGVPSPRYRPDRRLLQTRLVAPSRDGSVWAVAPGRYVLERWDPETGRRLATVDVRSSWFRESGDYQPLSERPETIIDGLWEDGSGLLWVLVRDADLEWRPPRPLPLDVWAPPSTLEDANARYDWILEAVDPASGGVVATRRFREYLRHYPPGSILISGRPEDYTFAVDVWKAELVTPRVDP